MCLEHCKFAKGEGRKRGKKVVLREGERAQCLWWKGRWAIWTLERRKFLKVKRLKRRKGKPGFLSDSRSDIRLCVLRSNCLSDKGKSRSARKLLFFKLRQGESDVLQLSYNRFFGSSHIRGRFLLLWLCDTNVDDTFSECTCLYSCRSR